ncbi:MAG: FtsX-like permease family protein [Phycisphaerae bacterium]
MGTLQLIRRSLQYYWLTHVAVLLGAAVGATALTGALLVGDSLRGSLRDTALDRLGPFDAAITSARPMRQALSSDANMASLGRVLPALIVSAAATRADGAARANQVQLIGIDRSTATSVPGSGASERDVWINDELARVLGVGVGDEIVLRAAKSQSANAETLMGRRDDPLVSLRVRISHVGSSRGVGGFSLRPMQSPPRNVFVPLATLQRLLGLRDRANAMLIDFGPVESAAAARDADVRAELRKAMRLADAGLRVRSDAKRDYVAIESESMLIEPPVEAAIEAAALEHGWSTSAILTYLANDIAIERGGSNTQPTAASQRAAGEAGIPYSVVAAVDPQSPLGRRLFGSSLNDGEIVLGEWAAADLAARLGDRVALRYYVTGDSGRLETQAAAFSVRAIAPLSGVAADSGFVPDYPGVTDTRSLSDWDPPFPMDLKRIRDKDEQYWDKHRTTPKAFVTLADGRRLWAEKGERFGRLTSVWIDAATVEVATTTQAAQRDAARADAVERALLSRIEPESLGIRVELLRERAVAAAEGPTDFGGLFIGFSMFVIASAAMLVALLFRLSAERRSAEIGTLLALGYSPSRIATLLVGEGAVLAAMGSAIGQAGATGYAWLMLAGLRTWWSAAVGAPFLELHVAGQSLAIGFSCSFMLAAASILLAVRGIGKSAPRALMSGVVTSAPRGSKASRVGVVMAGASGSLAAVAVLCGALGMIAPVIAFFLGSVCALVAMLCGARVRLRGGAFASPGAGAGSWRSGADRALTIGTLASRNAARQPGRSMLTISLIASAAFLIAALSAFQLQPLDTRSRKSGAGGFALVGESTTPVLHDLATRAGQAALDLDEEAIAALAETAIFPLRLRDGDAASCTNLYQREQPRVLGASRALVQRGGFSFSAVERGSGEVRAANPWALLEAPATDEAIPAIADEAAVLWQLKSGLGRTIEITSERGERVRLRFVALFSGSVLQDEIIVSEANFQRLFPGSVGRSFFLIDPPTGRETLVAATLTRGLGDFGMSVIPAAERLAGYLAVQNTYLSTFQTLGGIGLILGTLGLVAVTLRGVSERRREIAVLQAVGYSRGAVGRLVLSEQMRLVFSGLAIGVVAAAVAVVPAALDRPASIPWRSLGLTFAAVAMVAAAGVGVALRGAMRGRVWAALRGD